MQAEIEAKFLDVDHDKTRSKLKKLGAVCEQPMRMLRRKHYDYPDFRLQKENSFLRLRDEVNKVTLSYKRVDDLSARGTKEISTVVQSFAEMDALLDAVGMRTKSFHETKRESWRLNDVEIELDLWPWLEPLAEIEAPDEDTLWDVAKKLGFDSSKAVHGTIDYVYARYYEVTEAEVNKWPEITFGAVPAWLKPRSQS